MVDGVGLCAGPSALAWVCAAASAECADVSEGCAFVAEAAELCADPLEPGEAVRA